MTPGHVLADDAAQDQGMWYLILAAPLALLVGLAQSGTG